MHVLYILQFRISDNQFLAKERHSKQLTLSHVSLVRILKLNQYVVAILVKDFDLLHVAIVAEKIEQVSDLLLIVLRLRQVLNH